MGLLDKLTRRQRQERDVGAGDHVSGEATANGAGEHHRPTLERNLHLPTLVFLNISNTIGTGIHVLTGIAAHNHAGPFVPLSYLLAGCVCFMSALCFAEFAARARSASSGSSYSFVYSSLGELAAFIIGWLIFISSLASLSVTAITWSDYMDTLTNHTIRHFSVAKLSWPIAPSSASLFTDHADIVALSALLFVLLVSLQGVRQAALFNNLIALLNISLLVVITLAGLFFGKLDNLTSTPYTNGFTGILRGCGVVMYAFFGFESSTFAIEETIEPARNTPLSLLISLSLTLVLYCSSSLSLVLMKPFDTIDVHASYPDAFASVRLVYLIVSIGPLISMSGGLVSNVYAIVRLAFNMAKDGLLFRCFGQVDARTKIPRVATIISMTLCMALVLAIDIKDLIGFVDISGFLTYSLVAMGLLVLRYFDFDYDNDDHDHDHGYGEPRMRMEALMTSDDDDDGGMSRLLSNSRDFGISSSVESLDQIGLAAMRRRRRRRNALKRRTPLFLIMYIFFSSLAFGATLNHMDTASWSHTIALAVFVLSNLAAAGALSLCKQMHVHRSSSLSFKVPLIPFIPIVVIVVNNYLMGCIELNDWFEFAFVLMTGLPIYFFYGIQNSKL